MKYKTITQGHRTYRYNKKYAFMRPDMYHKNMWDEVSLGIKGGSNTIVIHVHYTMQELFDDFKARNMGEHMEWGYKKPWIENYGYRFNFDPTGTTLLSIDIEHHTFGVSPFIKRAMGNEPFRVKKIWERVIK